MRVFWLESKLISVKLGSVSRDATMVGCAKNPRFRCSSSNHGRRLSIPAMKKAASIFKEKSTKRSADSVWIGWSGYQSGIEVKYQAKRRGEMVYRRP